MKDFQDNLNNKKKQKLLALFFGVFVFVSLLSLGGAALFSYGNFTVYNRVATQQSDEIKTIQKLKSELSVELDKLHTLQTADKIDLSQQLALLREELIKMKTSQNVVVQGTGSSALTPTPNLTPAPALKGIVQLNKNWKTADIYQDSVASSKILGQAVSGKLYFTYGSKSGWYQIEVSPSQRGWVQAQLVNEL